MPLVANHDMRFIIGYTATTATGATTPPPSASWNEGKEMKGLVNKLSNVKR